MVNEEALNNLLSQLEWGYVDITDIHDPEEIAIVMDAIKLYCEQMKS